MRLLNDGEIGEAAGVGIEAWKKELSKRSVDCEPFIRSALLEAQHQQDIKDFMELLDKRLAAKNKRLEEVLYEGSLKGTLRTEITELEVLRQSLKDLAEEK